MANTNLNEKIKRINLLEKKIKDSFSHDLPYSPLHEQKVPLNKTEEGKNATKHYSGR